MVKHARSGIENNYFNFFDKNSGLIANTLNNNFILKRDHRRLKKYIYTVIYIGLSG